MGRVRGRCQVVVSLTAPTLSAQVVMAMKCCHVSVHFQIWLAYQPEIPHGTVPVLYSSSTLVITAVSHVKCDYRACEEITNAIQSQRKAPGAGEGQRDGSPQDRRAQIAPESPRTDILAVRTDVGDG